MRSADRSEDIARNWDLISVGSFVAAAAIGLVKTANDIRHKFYQACVIGYDNAETIFSSLRRTAQTKFNTNEQSFVSGNKTAAEYITEKRGIANALDGDIKKLMHTRMNISTQNAFADWTLGSLQRFKFLGRTNRTDAAMSFAGTATIALGAIAVLKHSSRVLDAINQRISQQEDKSIPR